MVCKKCGSILKENDLVCGICGETIGKEDNYFDDNNKKTNKKEQRETKIILSLIIILLIAAISIGLVLLKLSKHTDKLVCESNDWDIIFKYLNDQLLGYSTVSKNGNVLKVDMTIVNQEVNKYGLAEFLERFKKYFEW